MKNISQVMEFRISDLLPTALPRSVLDILKKGKDITIIKKLSMKTASNLSFQEKQSELTLAGCSVWEGPIGGV